MGFTAKQTQALRRSLSSRSIRTREANGRELSYIEGWYAISEANRIFGFDAWTARPWIRFVCSRARTAVHSLPFTSRKCVSPFRPVERRLYGRGMDRGKVGLPPQAKPTTQPLRLPRPTPPSGDRSDLSSIARIKMLPWRARPHLGLLR